MRIIKWCSVLIGFGVLMLWGSVSVAQDEQIRFFYQIEDQATNTSRICWFPVNAPDDESCITTPLIANYAIAPDGNFIAIRTRPDLQLHLVDIANGEVMPFNLCQPMQEFLWDYQYLFSGALLWSPSGRYLAFTGVESGERCTVDDNAQVYVYDRENRGISAITQANPPIRSLAMPASWSPDEQWLALYGAWTEQEGVPDFGSAIISRDGATFFEFAPDYNTCRLSWSPDMRWLASNTACFESLGVGSAIIAIPFDPTPLRPDGLRIDEVISPIRFDWRPDSTWTSLYSAPLWIDENILFAYRSIVPVSFGYLNEDETADFSVNGLVSINVDTFSETLLPVSGFEATTALINDWFAGENRDSGEITAFHPSSGIEFVIPPSVDLCPISYALHIEDTGNFIAVVNGCVSTTAIPSVDIYRTDDFSLIWRRDDSEQTQVRSLGFVTP